MEDTVELQYNFKTGPSKSWELRWFYSADKIMFVKWINNTTSLTCLISMYQVVNTIKTLNS